METSTRIIFAAATAALAVVAFCFAACPHQEDAATRQWTLSLKIHGKGSDQFLEVKDKDKFNRAMCDVKNHGGDISTISYQPDGGQTPYPLVSTLAVFFRQLQVVPPQVVAIRTRHSTFALIAQGS